MLDDLKISHVDLEVIKNIIQETERIYGEMITSISDEYFLMWFDLFIFQKYQIHHIQSTSKNR